ncbi:NAD(P)H-binding protein [Enterococcus casseliflavus]|uniref:NAD(P)H-binding protein n=1 Tax=Enterococcus casseliflavus TaxID=37734 RepID=UPI0022E4C613|nr:NAD(P)H-binding protein [Enterococcus casseliflavus]MEB6084604.1 NAD(P)H-binding protein [Enterococcus casseliflavus]MEB6148456.1 NAD(P)H-binding protein [Enterococcus casseliflavus]
MIIMKIGIIGATGNAGSAIYQEAVQRGHEVTAIVRNEAKAKEQLGETVKTLTKDAFSLTEEELSDFDVLVDAFATSPDKAYLHVDLAAKLVHLFREKDTRLFFILGAGSLINEAGERNLSELKKAPGSESWIAIPENQLDEYLFLETVKNVPWVGISPGNVFQEGPAKPAILGKDHLLFNEQKESVTSSGTLAKAIIDEIETVQHENTRFTVIDA